MFGGYTMEYQTYIFDLDGTLLDTLHDLAVSTNYALRTYGMPEHSEDDVRRFVGNGVKKLMERAIPEGTDNPLFDDAYACFRQHYLKHNLDTTAPYEGVMPMLKEHCCGEQQVLCRHTRAMPSFFCRICSGGDW